MEQRCKGKLYFMDDMEDLRRIEMREYRTKALNKDEWKNILKQVGIKSCKVKIMMIFK